MKKILFTIVFLTLSIFISSIYAQPCDLNLSGLKLTINQSKSGIINNACVLNFDLSFNINANNGNKEIYIFLWKGSDYSNGAEKYNWTANSSKMPRLADIDGLGTINNYAPIAVIGIDNVNKTFVTEYSADKNNITYSNKKLINGSSITSVDASGRTYITISNLELNRLISECEGSLSIRGRIASTNSDGQQPSIHCTDDLFDFSTGGLTVKTSSSLNCAVVPRTFDIAVEADAKTNISYSVYVDDGDDVLTENADGTISDPVGYTSANNITVDQPNPSGTGYYYSAGPLTIEGLLGTDAQYKDRTHFLILSYVNIFGTTTSFDYRLENNCNVLPVHYKSFSAYRNPQRKEQVLLKWETASEQNNRGFNVQRKVGGQWKNIAFVFSQTDNGNSNAALAYEYKEINTANTISQYQIQQVDFDGKTSYSDVKSVVGINQVAAVQVYPNPAVNGKVNLLFKEINNPKEVIVNDINGRVVKQFREVRDNTLTIEGLQSGFYTIKVTDRLASTTTVEKVIIKK